MAEASANAWAQARDTARALIAPFEGMHRRGSDGLIHPYRCPAGIPTQGRGIVVASMDAPPIPEREAERRFEHELNVYLAAVLAISPALAQWPHRWAAIASFAFNCGVARYRASTLRRCVDAATWPEACEQLLRWVRAAGRVLRGLQLRRQAEAWVLEHNLPLTERR